MTFFIIAVIIFFIIVANKKQKKTSNHKVTFKNSGSVTVREQSPKTVNEKTDESSQLKNTMKLTSQDDSVIDVSDLVKTMLGNIEVKSEFSSSYSSVPYWSHQYVYSYDEINYATKEQRDFYDNFKTEFLKRNFLSLYGNTNYAFILLFDLLNDFEIHKDYLKIENQLEDLGNNYPRTKSYCVSFLIKKLEEHNLDDEAERFREKNFQYDYDYWRLGRRYKKKLNLSNDQEQILNKIWFNNNVFNEVEFCKIEVLKQFLRAVEHLQANYVSSDSSFNNVIDELSDLVVRKYYRYKKGSQNYNYTTDTVQREIYGHILKLGENTIREVYGIKRKLNAEFNYNTPEIFASYYEKLISKLDVFFIEDQKNILLPDDESEKSLNASNTTRWKSKFEEISGNYKDATDFQNQVIKLAEENVKNPSVENIFYEASKFIAKSDKVSSLKLYLQYIDADLKSSKVDNKQMNKTIQKSLFKTEEQLNDFEKIVNDFVKDRNLDNALEKVASIYEPKRKKIVIDKNSIQQVQKLHSGTVDLLNEYLQDEYEEEKATSEDANNTEEIQINITANTTKNHLSKFNTELNLSELQKEVLGIFEKNSFTILQSELEELLKSKNQMMSSVIDSINESCFELIDDVLIEEDEDYFTILPDYYQKIQNND